MMIHLRFYADLNDFLPPPRRQRTFAHVLPQSSTLKDIIEAVGVPHPEVDLLLVNGEPVGFDYRPQAMARVAVYPRFSQLPIEADSQLRPAPRPKTRFVLDVHLGKLANYLRLFGFDTLYQNDYADETLAQIASEEQRILLSRDRGLLKRSRVTHGYWVRATQPREQLVEVLRYFALAEQAQPFRRCVNCNGLLEAVDKADISDQLEENTRRYYEEFYRCQDCGQIYWLGSHYERMQQFVNRVLAAT